MKLISAYNTIVSLRNKIFTTQDISILLGVTNKHGNQLLNRLAAEDLLIHLRRGLWALKASFDPFILPEYLTAPFTSYISLQTALHYHGLISQVPSNIYVISTARTRTYITPIGTFSVHHIQANLCIGYNVFSEQHIKMATPEKALFDFFYMKAAKNKLFYSLPEIEFPHKFHWQWIIDYSNKIVNVSRKKMVMKLIEQYRTNS